MSKETVFSIAQWHQETFPDCELEDQIAKFDEENKEYEESNSMEELADMFIVACGICRFDTITAMAYFQIVGELLGDREEIAATVLFNIAIEKKMAKNRSRVWEKTTQGSYHHVECNNF